ncbi:hypothetical protein RJT34_22740 [Clitoria ternatea]|uniref:Uncharacterized protein n=1 Tax=Clitoria ternatea TaxID=43366 RepID=A0AAN9FQR4_CLITE
MNSRPQLNAYYIAIRPKDGSIEESGPIFNNIRKPRSPCPLPFSPLTNPQDPEAQREHTPSQPPPSGHRRCRTKEKYIVTIVSSKKEKPSSISPSFIELSKGINSLDKVILQESRGSSAEVLSVPSTA